MTGNLEECEEGFGGADLLGVGFTMALRWFPRNQEVLLENCVGLLGVSRQCSQTSYQQGHDGTVEVQKSLGGMATLSEHKGQMTVEDI